MAAFAAILVGMIAFSAPSHPPPVETVQAAAQNLLKSLTDLPRAESFTARDGTTLAYRAYPGSPERLAVLVHGSSASGTLMHPLARELSKKGITAYALDIRGHGGSGKKGDVAFVGQLENDLEDFLRHIEKKHAGARRAMVGFSAGGAFTIRFAASDRSNLFDTYLALAPYVGVDAPSTRPTRDGGWVSVAVPRIIGLTILDRLGLKAFGSLPVLAFAIPPEQRNHPTITPSYSFRLFSNFSVPRDWKGTVAQIRRPLRVVVGSADEIFYAEKFDETFRTVRNDIPVDIVPGIDHTQLVTNERAIAVVTFATVELLKPH